VFNGASDEKPNARRRRRLGSVLSELHDRPQQAQLWTEEELLTRHRRYGQPTGGAATTKRGQEVLAVGCRRLPRAVNMDSPTRCWSLMRQRTRLPPDIREKTNQTLPTQLEQIIHQPLSLIQWLHNVIIHLTSPSKIINASNRNRCLALTTVHFYLLHHHHSADAPWRAQ